MFEVKPMTRENAPITAAFIGGSGSGKTYSALAFARGLVGPKGKIVLIDTEGGRPKIYAKEPEFIGDDGFACHIIDLPEPYTSERFRAAFKAAINAGADAVIIDTISHEHEGFLEYAEQEEARLSSRKDRTRAKWVKPKATRKRFYSAISSSHAHVIATIRLNRIVNMDVKPAVEIMKPECDKDFPYRLDLTVEIQPDHTTKIIKVPRPLIGMVENGVMIGIKHGQALAADIEGQAAPDMDKIALMTRLESAAEAGTESLQYTFKKEWKEAGPSGTKEQLQQMTPLRQEMQSHKERLKGLADAADKTQAEDTPPDELGSQPMTEPEQGEGEFFNSEKEN